MINVARDYSPAGSGPGFSRVFRLLFICFCDVLTSLLRCSLVKSQQAFSLEASLEFFKLVSTVFQQSVSCSQNNLQVEPLRFTVLLFIFSVTGKSTRCWLCCFCFVFCFNITNNKKSIESTKNQLKWDLELYQICTL